MSKSTQLTDTTTEEWRRECEARHVCNLPTLSDRRRYILGVRQQRGNAAADVLERDVRSEWVENLALYKAKKQTASELPKRRRKKPRKADQQPNALFGNIDGST